MSISGSSGGGGGGVAKLTELEDWEEQLTFKTKHFLTTDVAPAPMVVFILDDGYERTVTEALPKFAARAVPACAAVITGLVGTATFMTQSQIATLAAAGWEICNHSTTADSLAGLTEAACDAVISAAHTALKGWGFKPKSLVWPSGANDEISRRVCRKYYRSGITAQGGLAVYADTVPLPSFNVARTDLDSFSADLAGAKAKVDDAQTKQGLLIWMVHPNGTAGWNDLRDNILGQLLDYIISLGIPIVTLDAALDRFANCIDCGDWPSSEPHDNAPGGPPGFKVDYHGQVHFRGRPLFHEVDDVSAATTPTHLFLKRDHTVSYCCLSAAGSAGMPTTGGGTLMTVQSSTFVNRVLSSFQLWFPTGSEQIYRRPVSLADNNTWGTWFRVDGAIRQVTGVDAASSITAFPNGVSFVRDMAAGAGSVPANGTTMTVRGYRTEGDAASFDGRDAQILFQVDSHQVWTRRWFSSGAWLAWKRLLYAAASGAVTVDPGASIAANSVFEATFAGSPAWVLDLIADHPVSASPVGGLEVGLVWTAHAYLNQGLKIRIANPTAAAISTASRSWNCIQLPF